MLSSNGKDKKEILFLPREHKVSIFELTCNFLIIWNRKQTKPRENEVRERCPSSYENFFNLFLVLCLF